MDQLLRTHLLFLEDQLQQLEQQLTSPKTPPAAISLIKEGIQFRQDALEKLRHAIKLEQQLRKSESPAKPSPRPQDNPSRKL